MHALFIPFPISRPSVCHKGTSTLRIGFACKNTAGLNCLKYWHEQHFFPGGWPLRFFSLENDLRIFFLDFLRPRSLMVVPLGLYFLPCFIVQFYTWHQAALWWLIPVPMISPFDPPTWSNIMKVFLSPLPWERNSNNGQEIQSTWHFYVCVINDMHRLCFGAESQLGSRLLRARQPEWTSVCQ